MCEEGGRASVLNIDMKESLESQAYSGKMEEMEKKKDISLPSVSSRMEEDSEQGFLMINN